MQLPIAADVQQIGSALNKDAADEQTAMAVGGVFLAAHNCDAEAVGSAFEATDAIEKIGTFGNLGVARVTVEVVEGFVFGTPSNCIAEVEVLHCSGGHEVSQRLAVEVRGVTGVGSGAHIDEDLDAMLLQQFDEVLRRVRRMPDGINGSHPHLLSRGSFDCMLAQGG